MDVHTTGKSALNAPPRGQLQAHPPQQQQQPLPTGLALQGSSSVHRQGGGGPTVVPRLPLEALFSHQQQQQQHVEQQSKTIDVQKAGDANRPSKKRQPSHLAENHRHREAAGGPLTVASLPSPDVPYGPPPPTGTEGHDDALTVMPHPTPPPQLMSRSDLQQTQHNVSVTEQQQQQRPLMVPTVQFHPTDFRNTEAYRRVAMLESVVSRTPRMDPIACWPVHFPTGRQGPTDEKGQQSGGGFQRTSAAVRAPLALELEAFIRREHRKIANPSVWLREDPSAQAAAATTAELQRQEQEAMTTRHSKGALVRLTQVGESQRLKKSSTSEDDVHSKELIARPPPPHTSRDLVVAAKLTDKLPDLPKRKSGVYTDDDFEIPALKAHAAIASDMAMMVQGKGRISPRTKLIGGGGGGGGWGTHPGGGTTSKLETLPIYREAFACLIRHFPEYEQVMSLIKAEYDSVVDDLIRIYQQHLKLEGEHRTVTDSNNATMMGLKEQNRTAVLVLKKQIANEKEKTMQVDNRVADLTREVIQLREAATMKDKEVADMTDRIRLLSLSLVEQGGKIGKLGSKNQKLKADNDKLLALTNSLRAALQVSQVSVANLASRRDSRPTIQPPGKEGSVQSEPAEDSSLYMAGMVSSEVANATRFALVDDDALRETCIELEEEVRRLRRENTTLKTEVSNLIHKIEHLQRSQEDDTLTPRPRWIRANEVFPEFVLNPVSSSDEILEEFLAYVRDRTRDDLLENERVAYGKTVREWLVEEDLCEGDLVNKQKYLIGRGTGPHVPIYLRHWGKIRNRKMGKGDVEGILSKFWIARRAHLKNRSYNADPLEVFWLHWLTQECGNRDLAVETAYNILLICQKHQGDPDCGMFLRTLEKTLCEHVVFDSEDMLKNLKATITSYDKQRCGFISRVALHRILNRQFVTKTRDDMLKLRFLLAVTCKGAALINYQALFEEDEEGNQSKFVEMLRSQHWMETWSFTVDVEESIRCLAGTGEPDVSIFSIRNAIHELDVKMPWETIDNIIAFGCRMRPDDLRAKDDESFCVNTEDFLGRIRTGFLLKRFSAPQENDLREVASKHVLRRASEVGAISENEMEHFGATTSGNDKQQGAPHQHSAPQPPPRQHGLQRQLDLNSGDDAGEGDGVSVDPNNITTPKGGGGAFDEAEVQMSVSTESLPPPPPAAEENGVVGEKTSAAAAAAARRAKKAQGGDYSTPLSTATPSATTTTAEGSRIPAVAKDTSTTTMHSRQSPSKSSPTPTTPLIIAVKPSEREHTVPPSLPLFTAEPATGVGVVVAPTKKPTQDDHPTAKGSKVATTTAAPSGRKKQQPKEHKRRISGQQTTAATTAHHTNSTRLDLGGGATEGSEPLRGKDSTEKKDKEEEEEDDLQILLQKSHSVFVHDGQDGGASRTERRRLSERVEYLMSEEKPVDTRPRENVVAFV